MRSWKIIQELSKAFQNKSILEEKFLALIEYFLPFLLEDAEKDSHDTAHLADTLLDVLHSISSVMERQLSSFLSKLPQNSSIDIILRCFAIQKTITLKCPTILGPLTASSGTTAQIHKI